MYMSNKPAVSVIVPMYNTERFLRCCVDSLLRQTINNIEILLVDDGSPDAAVRLQSNMHDLMSV